MPLTPGFFIQGEILVITRSLGLAAVADKTRLDPWGLSAAKSHAKRDHRPVPVGSGSSTTCHDGELTDALRAILWHSLGLPGRLPAGEAQRMLEESSANGPRTCLRGPGPGRAIEIPA